MRRHTLWRMMFALALTAANLAFAAPDVPRIAAQDRPIRILFMHHSTGGGLIWEGGLRELFTTLGYEFWDHGYNDEGLTDSSGRATGINWAVPDDNTNPDGWYAIFSQPVTDPPENTLSHMLEFDVILFKSCFPASDITSEEQFEEYRQYYLAIRDMMDQHPDKLFIPFTTPPLVPNATTPENAARARRWAEYLTSDEYLQGHPNVRVFDLFSQLADNNGNLRAEYRSDESDSHPNTVANQVVAATLAEFVHQAILDFTPGAAVAPPVPPDENSQAEVSHPGGEETAEGGGVINDFEAGLNERWWDWTEQASLSWSAVEPGYESDHALQVDFDVAAGGSAVLGYDFEADPAWADAQGIAFTWRSDQPGTTVIFSLAVRDPAHPDAEASEAAPFEVRLVAPGPEWEAVILPWTDFIKAEWFGDAGVDAFDPANVIWLAFNVENWEQAQAGTLWVDDIQLVTGD